MTRHWRVLDTFFIRPRMWSRLRTPCMASRCASKNLTMTVASFCLPICGKVGKLWFVFNSGPHHFCLFTSALLAIAETSSCIHRNLVAAAGCFSISSADHIVEKAKFQQDLMDRNNAFAVCIFHKVSLSAENAFFCNPAEFARNAHEIAFPCRTVHQD